MSKDIRSRAPNFSREEQMLLCRIMEGYAHIIESKKTDHVKQAHKQEAWSKVTEIYNANTKNVPRPTENLISCYRNIKSKLKKQHSEAKMVLEDSTRKEDFMNALEENGKDWEVISKNTDTSVEVCKITFDELQKNVIKHDNKRKRVIMGTGGGPPPAADDDHLNDRFKKMIEPQIDGLFTIYDGDASLMKQYQESIPENARILPIENRFDIAGTSKCENIEIIFEEENNENSFVNIQDTPKIQGDKRHVINRTALLKKKKASPLLFNDNEKSSCKKKDITNIAFQTLAEAKLELVHLQKQVLLEDMAHQSKLEESTLEDTIKQNKHNQNMREKEMKIMEMELNDKIAENNFKEQYRQKELFLLDLKIKKFK